jgi:hypothetical protein
MRGMQPDVERFTLPGSGRGAKRIFNAPAAETTPYYAIIGVNMEENKPVPALPPSTTGQTVGGDEYVEKPSKPPIGLIIVAVVVLIAIIAGIVLLLRADNDTTGRVRDLFIILMALESIVIGAALIILIVQLATLINLLQNELKPIIESTSETVNTLKGTVSFIGDNVTEPIIKLNAYLAGIKTFFDLMSPRRKRR